jgi:acyl-CoA reductase-like NAD-dependent aldehyde dehydrogenase
MSFTGSPEVGRLVAEACGRNLVPVKLELGGKGAAVVFEDTDLATRREAGPGDHLPYRAGLLRCHALADPSADLRALCAASVERMKQVAVGYQFDKRAQMGPVVSEKQRERVLGYLQRGVEEGASSWCWKEVPNRLRGATASM